MLALQLMMLLKRIRIRLKLKQEHGTGEVILYVTNMLGAVGQLWFWFMVLEQTGPHITFCFLSTFDIVIIGGKTYQFLDKPTGSLQLISLVMVFQTNLTHDEAFFICNSIGGLVGLQAAVTMPQICKGLVLLNISLRMLHIKKQPWYGKPLIRSFQNLLRNTPVGKFFFRSVATPQSVKNILCQCYYDPTQVTDELVESILQPGLQPGAVDVFLEFICYSGGPLPEELIPQVKCPVLVVWGDKDPWEPIELGRAYGNFDTVEDFVVLPDVGHCPQDEAPHLVNPIVESFVARHECSRAGVSAGLS